MLDNIGYVEDRCHSMFRELPSQIEDASEVCGLLMGREWHDQSHGFQLWNGPRFVDFAPPLPSP